MYYIILYIYICIIYIHTHYILFGIWDKFQDLQIPICLDQNLGAGEAGYL